MLHTLNLADGTDLKPPVKFATGKAWALNLDGNILFMPIGSGQLHAMDLTDPESNDMSIRGRQRWHVGTARTGNRFDWHSLDDYGRWCLRPGHE